MKPERNPTDRELIVGAILGTLFLLLIGVLIGCFP